MLRKICCLVTILFSGCVHRSSVKYDCSSIKNSDISVFISMPRNNVVFDNVAPLVYQALYRQYTRLGYQVVDSKEKGYVLEAHIKSLEPTTRFVSPDIVLVHVIIRLEIECRLLNFTGQEVAKKTFFFSSLISKPRNPIINSDFVDYGYNKLLERSVPRIEHFFKQYLHEAFKAV